MGRPVHPITLAVLRHLHINGVRTRAEIVKGLNEKVPATTLTNLIACGHVAIDKTQTKEVRFYITPRGLEKLRNPHGRPKAQEAARRDGDQYYRPTEYTPSSRDGAMTAYGLPSRVGDRLRWPPDGRETDLNCNPL